MSILHSQESEDGFIAIFRVKKDVTLYLGDIEHYDDSYITPDDREFPTLQAAAAHLIATVA